MKYRPHDLDRLVPALRGIPPAPARPLAHYQGPSINTINGHLVEVHAYRLDAPIQDDRLSSHARDRLFTWLELRRYEAPGFATSPPHRLETWAVSLVPSRMDVMLASARLRPTDLFSTHDLVQALGYRVAG